MGLLNYFRRWDETYRKEYGRTHTVIQIKRQYEIGPFLGFVLYCFFVLLAAVSLVVFS